MTEPQNTTDPASTTRISTAPSVAHAAIRWGGVVWGVVLIAFAAVTLSIVSSPERAAGTRAWIASLEPGSAWALGAALLGLIIVVSALLGGIRASQRRRVR
ncbi:hypothetical protein [Leifsonia sp. 2MCAF36]|uniref:hypothetical protein n=1 Tax=Leifsonia sp. 2MCAF36 TaxID=3232988 RepID=UPI003F97CECB